MEVFNKTSIINSLYKENEELSALANYYETDKGTADSLTLTWGADYPNHRCMHYTNTYEKYMKGQRESEVSMLEIGVCDKRFPYASIMMWLSYFKDVDFYAVDSFWGDTLESKKKNIQELNRVSANFIYADQGSFKDWNDLIALYPKKFDFIVEDGSHWPNHMVVSLWKSIDVLKKGGYYFMEDIQNPLVSRGWFCYDNSLLGQELLEATVTNNFSSRFLNNQQNKDIQKNFDLIEMVLDPNGINYLAVFKKK